jgi:RimJ/RimL family protein N-acetyltransferase
MSRRRGVVHARFHRSLFRWQTLGVLRGRYFDEAGEALTAARGFLLREPVLNNVVLTLLEQRIRRPEPGRYWTVEDGAEVVGFAMQSPVTFKATVASGSAEAIDALVDVMFETAADLPGVIAEAATAARLAGRWTELSKVGAAPVEAQRIYVLGALRPPASVAGTLRRATTDDVDRLVEWKLAFVTDTGMTADSDAVAWTLQRIQDPALWLWERGEAVSMAMVTAPIAGVSRVGYVYTPPEQRGNGYAAAVVSAVSAMALEDGATTCMLYTELANPTSNAIYRRIGYEPRAEVESYSFGLPGRATSFARDLGARRE